MATPQPALVGHGVQRVGVGLGALVQDGQEGAVERGGAEKVGVQAGDGAGGVAQAAVDTLALGVDGSAFARVGWDYGERRVVGRVGRAGAGATRRRRARRR